MLSIIFPSTATWADIFYVLHAHPTWQQGYWATSVNHQPIWVVDDLDDIIAEHSRRRNDMLSQPKNPQ